MTSSRSFRSRLLDPGTRNRNRRWLCFGIVLTTFPGWCGCEKNGVDRYDLKGQITYDGKPVPMGHLRFAPDTKQGNRGPGTYATILDGKYEMMPGQGTVGGPHIVSIFGTDGIEFKNEFGSVIPIGRPLFPEYEVSVDIPKEAATHDFVVPVEPSGNGKGKKATP